MYQVPEEDRKEILKYHSRRPYIEVAALITRIAAWKKIKNDVKEKKENGKDRPN